MSHDLSDHLISSRETASCAINQFRFTGHRKLARESHEGWRLGILMQGGFTNTGSLDAEIRGGSLVVYPPKSDAGAGFCEGQQHFLWIAADKGLLLSRGTRKPSWGRPVAIRSGAPFRAACRIATLFFGPSRDDKLMIESAVEDIIADVADGGHAPSDPSPPWWDELLDHLALAGNDLDLATLANSLGIHRSHLARTFKRRTGHTLGQHRLWLRLQRSSVLLKDTEKSIAQIAAACGFFDQAHFCRTFRAEVGATPSAYRAANR